MQQMKFHGGYRTAVAIGHTRQSTQGDPEFADVDFLVPVPLHPERMRQRAIIKQRLLYMGFVLIGRSLF